MDEDFSNYPLVSDSFIIETLKENNNFDGLYVRVDSELFKVYGVFAAASRVIKETRLARNKTLGEIYFYDESVNEFRVIPVVVNRDNLSGLKGYTLDGYDYAFVEYTE